MSLGPLQGENQGNPADRSGVRFNRVEACKCRPHRGWQLDPLDLVHPGVGAVLRWRGDQILAAGDRPLGMDRARFVVEKRAGDTLTEISQSDFATPGIVPVPPALPATSATRRRPA